MAEVVYARNNRIDDGEPDELTCSIYHQRVSINDLKVKRRLFILTGLNSSVLGGKVYEDRWRPKFLRTGE